MALNAPEGYETLCAVLGEAVEQASRGKGKERHASDGEAYSDQIICEVTRRLGPGYPLGQAVKKIYESQRIGGEKGVAELLGAINYIAAAIIVDREMDGHDRALFAKECARAEVENPRFMHGDLVQYRVTLPSVSDRLWVDGTYDHLLPHGAGHMVRGEFKGDLVAVGKDDVRRRPEAKAEGCEDLVFDEARMRNSMPGIVPQDGPSDMDAIAPATYGVHIE